MKNSGAAWYELEQDPDPGLKGPWLLAGGAVAMLYVAFVAEVAGLTGAFYVMFPELGALAYDVFGRPRGHWSNSPLHLATTPTVTGAIGILITRNMPYGFVSVLLNIGAALTMIVGLGSPISPAISAGLLPLVLGVKSWWYPPGILFGAGILALASFPWRILTGGNVAASSSTGREGAEGRAGACPELAEGTPVPLSDVASASPAGREDSAAPRPPRGIFWVIALVGFVVFAVAIVKVTGLRFILFPPLVVIAYEMFGHVESCVWASRPFRLPIVCFLAASGGLFLCRALGVNAAAAACSMAWGMVVVQLFRVHVPPALAVALLPMVMKSPTAAYPVSVGLGTLGLTLWFWWCRDRLTG